MTTTPHDQLVAYLTDGGVPFRMTEHGAEGRSEEIAKIRGALASQGMKAIIVGLRGGGQGKEKRYVMAVLPGDRKLDMKALRKVFGAQKSSFADPDTATTLTGCVMGAIPPFPLLTEMPLVVDPSVRQNVEVCFNAGCLERSIFMSIDDYFRIASPQEAAISAPPE